MKASGSESDTEWHDILSELWLGSGPVVVAAFPGPVIAELLIALGER